MTIAAQLKVQSADITQGPITRWQGLCKLHLGLAGGTLSIAGVKIDDARIIRAAVMRKVVQVDYSEIAKQ